MVWAHARRLTAFSCDTNAPLRAPRIGNLGGFRTARSAGSQTTAGNGKSVDGAADVDHDKEMSEPVRRLGPEEWRLLREVRLRALADAPYAFGSTREEDAARDDEWWKTSVTTLGWFVAVNGAEATGLIAAIPREESGDHHVISTWVAPGARSSMMDDLEWLGLLGDEEPHDQVDLADHHRDALNRLIGGGSTYADGDAVRFKVPAEGSVDWDDLVRGPVVVANEDLDDPVLVRSSGAPTFFLASTADDIHDRVSDLIRPDVLLRASAKQPHIWAALGHRPPRIGHHPLMKRPGGQNVTAASGDGSVRRLRDAGIHPAALVAYLAMPQVASWKAAPVGLEDVIERFDPRQVSRRPMAFDVRVLGVLNRRLAEGRRRRP